jgi:PKD repeat protein
MIGLTLKALPVVCVVILLSMTSIGGFIAGIQPSTLAPVADANGPYSGWVGETIIFDGTGSTGTIINYTWDFGDGDKGYGVIPTHVYSSPGTYPVTLAVLSGAYEMDTDTTYAYIYEHNYAPMADANGPYYGDVGVPVSFDGCSSHDIDGTITSYYWNFGDGYYGTGPTPSHVYSSSGTFVVTLTVTDNDAATDQDTTYAYIGANQQPIADAGGPYTADVGDTITFDASGSTDPDGFLIGYRWDWTNDGTWDTVWLSSPYATYSYATSGTYTVKLEVKDDDGATDTNLATVTVPGGNQKPSVPQRPNGPTVGYVWNTYTYTTYTTDPEDHKVYYIFDWGDGTTSSTILYDSGATATAFHSWVYQGSFAVRVKAIDEHGAESAWSEPLPITMPLSFSMPIGEGGLYVFGRKILDMPTAIVVGSIAITPSIENAHPENPVEALVEYYMGKVGIDFEKLPLIYTTDTAPYHWLVSQPLLGSYVVSVVVHDTEEGYATSESMQVTFFMLGVMRGSQQNP